jgi:hypothetical protein
MSAARSLCPPRTDIRRHANGRFVPKAVISWLTQLLRWRGVGRWIVRDLLLQRLDARPCERGEITGGKACKVILVHRECSNFLGALPMRLRPRAVGGGRRCRRGRSGRNGRRFRLDAILRELLGNIRLCCLRSRNIGVAETWPWICIGAASRASIRA